MPTPNPDAKLREVCPELAEIFKAKEEDLKESPIHIWRNYRIDHKSIDAIAARMLELAQENERLKEENRKMENAIDGFDEIVRPNR